MKKTDLLVKVLEIKGKCPVYIKGDSFSILEGRILKVEKPICLHSLTSILPYYLALSRGIQPKEIGLGKKKIAYI